MSVLAAPVDTCPIYRRGLPRPAPVTLVTPVSLRMEAMLLLNTFALLMNEPVRPVFPRRMPWLVRGESWIQHDLWWNVTAESCQSPVCQVCQMIPSSRKAWNGSFSWVPPPPNLTDMHQIGAQLLTASLFHSAVTTWEQLFFGAWTHTITHTSCQTEDSTGQFFCTDYWHVIRLWGSKAAGSASVSQGASQAAAVGCSTLTLFVSTS